MGGGIPSALFKNFRLKGLEIAILAQKKLVFLLSKGYGLWGIYEFNVV